MSTITRTGEQIAFAELARASGRARLAGTVDPADDAATITAMIDKAHSGAAPAEIAAWWAHEFAALGSRRDALRCAVRAWPGLPVKQAIATILVACGRPKPHTVWT